MKFRARIKARENNLEAVLLGQVKALPQQGGHIVILVDEVDAVEQCAQGV